MAARRLTPLIVAFVLAFAPIARAACDVSCLEHPVEIAAEGSAHHHHSDTSPTSAMPAGHIHHHTAATTTQASQSGVVMVGQSHVCDHSADLVALSAAVKNSVETSAIMVSSVELPEIDADPLRIVDVSPRPSARSVLTTQLRV